MSGLKDSIGSLVAFSYSGFSFVSLPDLWGVIFGVLSGLAGLALTGSMIWYNIEKARMQRTQRMALQSPTQVTDENIIERT